jgi:glucosamine 6-phosphate synthetase-like amidotransferase/phosphosugar isomerase protein
MVIVGLERMDYRGCDSAGINFVTLRTLVARFRDVGVYLCSESCRAGEVEHDPRDLGKTVAAQ